MSDTKKGDWETGLIGGRDVHIHFFPATSGEIERYLLFRDFVRSHAETRNQYAAL